MGEFHEGRPGAFDSGEDISPPAPRRRLDVVDVWLAHTPGEVIADRYLLVKKLDQGGMGVVWIAHHLGLDIHVALKLLHPTADMAEAAERLVLEARAAARIDHPAIVHVHDVGHTAEGDPFLVMELLEGEPLGDVLAREKRLRPVTAMQIVLPIAGALAAMHAKGILHRDVKPDNIFLAQDDAGRWQPKLIDFGLARLEARKLSPITQRGMVVGTPVYLAPERIWGEEADPRDDVWSLSVALYEMLTGKVPFEGDHPAQILLAVRAGEPPSLASHGIDEPELWAILKRGLARRSARWASVRELGAALARELWKRGVTQDISGVSLWPSWVDGSDDLRRTTDAPPPGPAEHPHGRTSTGISAKAASAALPAQASPGAGPAGRASLPPLAETLDGERALSLRVSIKRPAFTPRPFTPPDSRPPASMPPASMRPASMPPASTPPTAATRRGRSPATWLSVGAFAVVALAATFVLGRRSERPEEQTGVPLASTIAPPPTLVVEAAPPSTTAHEGTSTAAASAQTAQAHAFTMGETPKPPPQASPPNPHERAVVTSPPAAKTSRGADEDLKNPFH